MIANRGQPGKERKGKDCSQGHCPETILNVARLCLSRNLGVHQSQCSRRENPGMLDERRPWFQGKLYDRDFCRNGDLRKGIWEAGPGGFTRLHMLYAQDPGGPAFGSPPGLASCGETALEPCRSEDGPDRGPGKKRQWVLPADMSLI